MATDQAHRRVERSRLGGRADHPGALCAGLLGVVVDGGNPRLEWEEVMTMRPTAPMSRAIELGLDNMALVFDAEEASRSAIQAVRRARRVVGLDGNPDLQLAETALEMTVLAHTRHELVGRELNEMIELLRRREAASQSDPSSKQQAQLHCIGGTA